MATTRIRIYTDMKNKEGKCAIYLIYTHNGKSLRMVHTKLHIAPKNFSNSKQRVNSKFHQAKQYNEILEQKKREFEDVVLFAQRTGASLNHDNIRKLYKAKTNTISDKKANGSLKLIDCFNQFIEASAKDGYRSRSPRTVRNYNSVKNILMELNLNPKVDLINDKFFDSLLAKLFKNNINNHTIKSNHFKIIKTCLHWAKKKGLTTYIYNYDLDIDIIEPPVIYLNRSEIDLLKEYVPQTDKEISTKLIVRFICNTGLRHSDLVNYDINAIEADENGKLKHRVYIRKTKEYRWLPLNKTGYNLITRIFEEGHEITSSQKLNTHSKDLCENAGINQKITKRWLSGSKVNEDHFEKWELCTMHTFRRTYGRLIYDKTGSILQVQHLLCQKDERSTRRYIGLEASDLAVGVDDIDA